jgi:hypothetical protein
MKDKVQKSWQSEELQEVGGLGDQVIELDSVSGAKYGGKKMRIVRFSRFCQIDNFRPNLLY